MPHVTWFELRYNNGSTRGVTDAKFKQYKLGRRRLVRRRKAMTDEEFHRLGAQVQALELIIKTMVGVQFAASVKSETGFGGAVDMAKQVADRLRAHVQSLSSNADPATLETGMFQIMQAEMQATIGRCFDAPTGALDQIAEIVLRAMDTPSGARN